MSISDPANLFQRVPELRTFSDDPKISRAIESGDPFKVYRSLVLARLFRRLPQHKDVLKELTSERRLFAKPLKGTPSLGTINSVGFSFVGESERDTDGSHIALHAFVILFGIPLVPMGSYVVRSTGDRQWQIYARAPLGIMGWLYTRGLALAMVIMVLTGAAASYQEASTQNLTILNGFDIPVKVRIGEQTLTVAAQGRATMTLPVGHLTGEASSDKTGIIDSYDQTLASTDRFNVWNIAGAAPLVENTIIYSKVKPATPGQAGSQTVYCGKRLLEFAGVEYLFTEPPQTKSMSKHQSSVSAKQLTVVNQADTPAVMSCLNYAFGHGLEKDMLPALEAYAAIKDWDTRTTDIALYVANGISRAEALRLSRKVLKIHPDNVLLERGIQDLRDDIGEHDIMLKEYAQRASQAADSSSEQYLYASLLSGNEGLQAMKNLAKKFPQDANILRSLTWRKFVHGDSRGAAQDLQQLHKLSPENASYLLDTEIKLLLTQQRSADALKLLDAAINNSKGLERAMFTVEFNEIARQQGIGDPEKYLRSMPDDENDNILDIYRAKAGLPPNKTEHRDLPMVKLSLSLRSSPEQTLDLVKHINTTQVRQHLGADQLALLYGESSRINDKTTQDKLRQMMHMRKADLSIFEQYVRGEKVNLDEVDFETDVLAAAYFIRSRNPQLSAQERQNLRQLAAKTDVLQGVVSTAIRQWKS
ncbi:tetratricopeptide repeat protein [Undibacterium sp. Tian12W]|uniref:tetratricopeptide repeat protein n=1 Tax=Undibacterium sp. Tian12W TaxID=3413054 RepID=UPI003BF18DD6